MGVVAMALALAAAAFVGAAAGLIWQSSGLGTPPSQDASSSEATEDSDAS